MYGMATLMARNPIDGSGLVPSIAPKHKFGSDDGRGQNSFDWPKMMARTPHLHSELDRTPRVCMQVS